MSNGSANTLWARSFADELARAGVREVALAPGSRSTPLVLAFAEDGRFRMRVHLDERCAAFFALGVGKASRRPAAMVTTSGTAAANVFPAVVEASSAETPLLVLTADRPPHLRDADANQTMDQARLYGSFARDSFDVSPPVLAGPQLRHLRTLAARAVAGALGPPAGPVHLNFPFDKPLEPSDPPPEFLTAHPLAASGRPDGAPFVEVDGGRRTASGEELEALSDALRAPRGVIVAGPSSEPERLGPAVWALAAATGLPLLADPLSGARYGAPEGVDVIAAYDLFLRADVAVERLEPSFILRVGSSPTSAALLEWILHHNGVPHLVVDGGGRWKDHGATATRYVRADAAETLAALSAGLESAASRDWLELWRTAESAALSALDERQDDSGSAHEGAIWRGILAASPPDSTLFVSGSMPVRDLDAFGHPRAEALTVYGNRGVSGIDGIVSTAFGVASQRPDKTVCVLGDVAFFHDQNGLLWHREDDASVVFVLVDNDGGGIFHMLPVAEHEPHFTEYVATPHGLDLRHAAALHGIELEDVTISDLETALGSALQAGGTSVLRVRGDRAENHRRHVEIARAVSLLVQRALPEPGRQKGAVSVPTEEGPG